MKKTFSAESLRKSLEKNFFSQKPEEIARKRPLPRPGKLGRMRMCITDDYLRESGAIRWRDTIEEGPQAHGIFFGFSAGLIGILFDYRIGSIFAPVL